jgi:SulP family sulfate permease
MNKNRSYTARIFPVFASLKNYSTSLFKSDLSAGITVGVMLIPQGMAYAMIAGLPAIYGLYASTIPLIIYAIFGTSRQMSVGPAAMISLLTAAGIGAMAKGDLSTYIGLAVLLAFLVGVIQFFMGALKLGFLVNFLSHPVIAGFSSAAALIIGLSQLKHLLGIELSGSNHVHMILWEAILKIKDTNVLSFGIGAGGIAIILLLNKYFKRLPSQIIVVFLGVLIVWLGQFDQQGVAILGAVPKGLPMFALPAFNMDQMELLVPIALSIAFVSFMQSIAMAKAIQARHKDYTVEANQELVALGLSNMAGSFFQSFPVTGGFSRTAVNDQAGAKTTMASIISALIVALTLLFLTPLFYYLPKAILASVIMMAVFGLIDYKEALFLWKTDRLDFWLLIISFLATLILGIEQGILIGVVLSLVMVIYNTAYPHYAELGKIPGSSVYRNKNRFKEVELREDVLIMRFDAQLYFANVDHFRNALNSFIEERSEALKLIVLNFDSINSVDSSALHTLKDMIENARSEGINLYFSGVKGPVRDKMKRSELTHSLGEESFFLTVQEAIDTFDTQISKSEQEARSKFTLQTNDR